MSTSWDDFELMEIAVKNDTARIHTLAEKRDPSDREEFDMLCQRIFDTTSKMLEMTGDYTPDISNASDREKWQAMKSEAESTRTWLLQNKGRLWPSE
jgi:hypothetical protein